MKGIWGNRKFLHLINVFALEKHLSLLFVSVIRYGTIGKQIVTGFLIKFVAMIGIFTSLESPL